MTRSSQSGFPPTQALQPPLPRPHPKACVWPMECLRFENNPIPGRREADPQLGLTSGVPSTRHRGPSRFSVRATCAGRSSFTSPEACLQRGKGNAAAPWAPPARAGVPPSVSLAEAGRRLLRKLNPCPGSAEVARGPAPQRSLCAAESHEAGRGLEGPRRVPASGPQTLCRARGRSASALLALATSGQWAPPAVAQTPWLRQVPRPAGAFGGGQGSGPRPPRSASPAGVPMAGTAATYPRLPVQRLGARGTRGEREGGPNSSASEAGPGPGSPAPRSRWDCALWLHLGSGRPETLAEKKEGEATGSRPGAGTGGGRASHRPTQGTAKCQRPFNRRSRTTPGPSPLAPRPLSKGRGAGLENSPGDLRR